MNISLKSRVSWSFAIVNALVLVLGLTVFFYLKSLNRDIEQVTLRTKEVNLHTGGVRKSVVSILRNQRKILQQRKISQRELFPELVEKTNFIADSLATQLQKLDSLYNETEIKHDYLPDAGLYRVFEDCLEQDLALPPGHGGDGVSGRFGG